MVQNNTTILTTALFQQYCDDYFLGASAPKNILNAHVQQQLPTIIRNVEASLNAMVNGRLYKMFPPANVVFNGTANLTAESQEITLYSMLTEAVLYKLKTGSFVNVNNSFSGNVNGNNNFSTSNSNVVGLRNDIRDKLVQLGLYKNAQFTNATTPNKYMEASPGTNQPAGTVQQTAQLNSYLSTNNFTLGGSWNFANLGIDGTPIQQYIQEQLGSLSNYNATLINYLPSNPIPLITSKDIQKGNNAQSVNLEPINASIQSLTTNLNTTNKELTSLGEQFTTVLAPYVSGSTIETVPAITPNDITNGNNNLNASVILGNYIPAAGQSPSLVPLITQADITKGNNNSGSTGSSFKIVNIEVEITNTGSIDTNNSNGNLGTSTANLPFVEFFDINYKQVGDGYSGAFLTVKYIGTSTVVGVKVYPKALTTNYPSGNNLNYPNGSQVVGTFAATNTSEFSSFTGIIPNNLSGATGDAASWPLVLDFPTSGVSGYGTIQFEATNFTGETPTQNLTNDSATIVFEYTLLK